MKIAFIAAFKAFIDVTGGRKPFIFAIFVYPAENFSSILKTECIFSHKISTRSEARQLIDEYIDFFNSKYFQTKKSLKPLEKRCQARGFIIFSKFNLLFAIRYL